MDVINLFGSIILGVIAGSLVNFLSDVLPPYFDLNKDIENYHLIKCTECGNKTSLLDYFKFSTCKKCNHKTAKRNWIVILFYICIFVFIFMKPTGRFGTWDMALLLVYLGTVVIIDLEHRVILDAVSIVGILIAVPLGWRHHGLFNTLIGGSIGFGIMLFLYYLGILFTKWMSRKRGQSIDEVALGAGDIKLAGILGLILGWPGITLGLFIAILAGGFVSLLILVATILIKKYRSFMAIPYAPFLVLGTVLLLFLP